MQEQPVAERLHSIADSIQGVFLKSEHMCLSAGESLGAALDCFGKLAGIFRALPEAFEAEDFKAAIGQLSEVTNKITAIGTSWVEEQGDLVRLIELSHKLTEPINRLRGSIRTICAVTIYAKVEVRSIDTHGDDLNSFIEDLTRLANSSQSTIEGYWAEHGKLLDLLQSSRDAQAGFALGQKGRLSAVTKELEDSIETIAGRRRKVSESAGEISQRSQEISQAIGAVVMALQVGDSTRQRIEHVKDGLEDIGAACGDEEAPPAAANDAAPSGGSGSFVAMARSHAPVADRHGAILTAGAACRLQSMQTSSALEDFDGETSRIRAALGKLADQATAMVELGSKLVGGAGSQDESFLAILKTRLAAAEDLIRESQAARSSVDRVMASSMDTLTGLQQRVTKLSEIVVDMTLIGMNGILKSIRVGSQGKGLSVIAQELRNYANHAIEAANYLKPALQQMIAAAAVFEQRLKKSSEDGMTELGRSMSQAMTGVERMGSEIGEALRVLAREGAAARETLKSSASEIGIDDGSRQMVLEAIAALDAIAEDLDRSLADFPGEATATAFWSRYTMASERDIHNYILDQNQAMAA